MRVLVVSAPLVGHLFPLVPFAHALDAAGHEVLVATAAEAVPAARAAGFAAEDTAPAFRFGRIITRLMLTHPLLAKAELAGNGGTRVVARLFGAVNAELLPGVVALAERWAPDLVVHEPLAAAGAVAAGRLGVPAVLHGNSLFDGDELVRVTGARLRQPVPPNAAAITIAPASVVGPRAGWPMRAVPYSGEGAVPDWLLAPPADRPRIVVSRSTVGGPGSGGLMRAVVAAAAEVDAEFVLVRPDRVGPLPPNVRTVDRTPLTAILGGCAGIVHHGGAGTVFAALAAGVPQLVAPGPGDRRTNARLVAERGAGLAVPANRLGPADLTRLVTDAGLVRATADVRREMAAMPEPEEVVARLESLPRNGSVR
jgi:UDP:flavonoid glycosyltransferase YjiC (YdhE family)